MTPTDIEKDFRFALLIEYKGDSFNGFQAQKDQKTVQSTLTDALRRVFQTERVIVIPSGRTDSGVTAYGQVVTAIVRGAKKLPDKLEVRLSGIMKPDCAVLKMVPTDNSFHARFSPHQKQYSYKIVCREIPAILEMATAWHVPYKLNIPKMKRAAAALEGTHDFKKFRNAGCAANSTIRTIFISEILQDKEMVTFRIVGTGFLKQMVRILAGSLVEIGRENLSVEDFISHFSNGENGITEERIKAKTAPPHGLTLDWVRYSPPFDDIFGS